MTNNTDLGHTKATTKSIHIINLRLCHKDEILLVFEESVGHQSQTIPPPNISVWVFIEYFFLGHSCVLCCDCILGSGVCKPITVRVLLAVYASNVCKEYVKSLARLTHEQVSVC